MVFEPNHDSPNQSNCASLPSTVQEHFRYRIRFRKEGDLRLVSHHDLLHCFERMLRRANLPVRYTKGYHPHPCLTFALSLALGVKGCAEVVELELTAFLPSGDIQKQLACEAPPGLVTLSVRPVSSRGKMLVRRAWYRTELPLDRCHDLPMRVEQLLATSACWIDRARPQPRRLDVRPYISKLQLAGPILSMALWITPNGAARPEEILRLLGLGDLYENGEVLLERTDLELDDEVAPGSDPMPIFPGPTRDPIPMTTDP